jgi:voltage-gated potassium channel Kch
MNMIPFFISLGGFAIALISGQMGARQGAYLALCGMLSVLFGALAALRYWFLLSRLAGEHEENPVPLHFIIIFWVIFVVTVYLVSRLRHNFTDVFESGFSSLPGWLLGAIFGLARGTVIMALVMMTVSVGAPQFWPGYRADQLPLPVDHWPLQAYRFIETHIARVASDEPGHTPLPALTGTSNASASFWQ